MLEGLAIIEIDSEHLTYRQLCLQLSRKTGFSVSIISMIVRSSLVPRPLLIRYVVWQYAARFLGKTEAIGHVTSAH